MNPHPLHIGERRIGEGEPCFIIAEIGSNHNGSLACAKEMIEVAAKAGVDAVKFQSIQFEEIYSPRHTSKEIETLIRKIELPEEWYADLAREAEKNGVFFLSAPTYARAVDLLEEVGVLAYKVASPQSAAHPALLRKILRQQKPTIISTGYSTLPQIEEILRLAKMEGNDHVALLHCVSEYPTRPERANLRAISMLKSRFGIPVGFSDHTLGIQTPVWAVAAGANLIEKHFTLDHRHEGPDHFFAVEPPLLAEMVKEIRTVEKSLGDGRRESISEEAEELLKKVRTRILSRIEIPAGTPLKEELFVYRRASEGIFLEELPQLTHGVMLETIPPLTPITWDKVKLG